MICLNRIEHYWVKHIYIIASEKQINGMDSKNGIQKLQQALEQEGLLNRIINRICQSLELQEILTTTVQEVRSFLGIDRVKIYRFHPDSSGQVIAESIDRNRLPPLLGLHFPAGDIPPHVREMFVRARQRVTIDVGSGRKGLDQLDCPETGESLGVEDIAITQRIPATSNIFLAWV